MKKIAFILMSFMLLITFLPGVSAAHFCCDDKAPASEQSSSSDNSESCPPLCYCTCCGHLYIVNEAEAEFRESNPEIFTNPEFVPSFAIKAIPNGIWKPPQIVESK